MRHSVEDGIELARNVKKLTANNSRLKEALKGLLEATNGAPSLTEAQKTAIDRAIKALQFP